MSNTLRGKRISESYQRLVQVIEGTLYDGNGNPISIVGSSGGAGFQGPQGFRGLQGYSGQAGPQGTVGPQGAVNAASPRDTVSVGGTYTWDINDRLLVIDPPSLLASLSLILPDTSSFSGGELYWLSFGGQITSGSVITSLTIEAYPGTSGPGSGILATTLPTTFQVGDGLTFLWDSVSQKWRLF